MDNKSITMQEAEMFFSHKYPDIVMQAKACFLSGDMAGMEEHLSNLPTHQQLLTELIQKLRGKSVYKSLQKSDLPLKALFSLGTHIAIEREKGNEEYGCLLYPLYERIGKALLG